MLQFTRRDLLRTGMGAGLGLTLPASLHAQTDDAEPAVGRNAAAVTQILSRFVAGSRFDQLSLTAIEAAKRGIMDTLGVILAAVPEDVSGIVGSFARDHASRTEATVIGRRFKANADLAAYANGTMAHALDYDNVIHVGNVWMGHPSVVILPAVLAVAEQRNMSGRDLLLGYALGLQLYTTIGLLSGNQPYLNGWHNTSYIGTVAGAGAVARMLGLNAQQTERCFGIAGSSAGGLRQNFGTMTKPLHAGNAARGAVEAAELAGAGLTGSEHIFEGALGFRSAFIGRRSPIGDRVPLGDDLVTADAFAAGLGHPWSIADPGMAYKICPSCRSSHYGLEAGLQFRQLKPFAVADIAEVECHVSREMGAVLFYHAPKKGLEGKFSLEYVLARTLLDGVPKTTDFTDARVNDPLVRPLMARMKWMPFDPPAKDPGFPTFVFRSSGGKEYRTRIEHLTGEPEHPVSNALLVGKFDDCASALLAPTARRRVSDMVFGLEGMASIGPLMAALSG